MPHTIAPRLPTPDVIPMKLDRTAARALLLESYAAAVGAADPLKIVAD
ncbi:glycerate kinase, partial [Salmonella enterica subsp. enterica serovar Mbandaka]